MADRARVDERFRELADQATSSPVRWGRVHALARKRMIIALVGLTALGVAATVVLVVGTVAGKHAIDPSFSVPLISRAATSIETVNPDLGRQLTVKGQVTSGYLVKAKVDVVGLEGHALSAGWRIRPVGRRSADAGDVRIGRARFTPMSEDDSRWLSQWVPAPRRAGRYVAEVILRSAGGEQITAAASAPFYVFARNCCSRYRAPDYVALLPRRWPFLEDYAPQPGSRFVTLVSGPAGSSVDIDMSTRADDPAGRATALQHLLAASSPDYHSLNRRRYRLGGREVVEWSYEVEGDAFTDIFFDSGVRHRHLFAVLGRSGPSHFLKTRDLTRLVARSVAATN